jgi:hypothetical protein
LRGARIARGGLARETRLALAAGAAAAFCSTLGSAALLRRRDAERSLAPYALYRCLLAGLITRSTRDLAGRTADRVLDRQNTSPPAA